jgi:hypothetical protein
MKANQHIALFSVILLAVLSSSGLSAQQLKVSDNQRYLVTEDGKPFFWMADTAWELIHRLNREEANFYMETRASQGFNVIQAVVLAELDGLETPNAYGHLPLRDNDPLQPQESYFNHVDYIIDKADSLGIYIALLPTWGDKIFRNTWGIGPVIFTPENSYAYGRWLGERYKDKDNLIWIVGGDRNPRADTTDAEIWNQLAEGIASGAGGYQNTLMSFHPQPHEGGGSSTWFHTADWLDFNMHQTGHCADKATYSNISHDYALQPVKPVLDGEPLYEDHPNCFNAKELGYSLPRDIRRIMYWNVFAGAFGQTYGCHDVWQMYSPGREPVNQPLRPWKQALGLPMASQVKHLKNLMLSRPYLSRVPDPGMIVQPQEDNEHYVIATSDLEGGYAMVYFPTGKSVLLNLDSLRKDEFKSWWFDPRTGNAQAAGRVQRGPAVEIRPPTSGPGNDWVLVIDAREYPPPGSTSHTTE